MKLRNSMVALLATGMLLSGCEVQQPSSASDNAVPPASAAAGYAVTPLFKPLAQDASKIPFPTDLLFADSTNGNLAAPVTEGASNASVLKALNTSSGFSTTAMLTIPFSAPLAADQDFSQSLHIFWATGTPAPVGNFALAGVEQAGACAALLPAGSDCTTAAVLAAGGTIPHLITPASTTTSLTYGVDYVAQVSEDGKTLAILPLKPLQSATSYIIVVDTSLKAADGSSVAAGPQYTDARTGKLAPLASSLTPKVQLQEALSGIPSADIALSYSVTTQNIKAPLAQAQGQVAMATTPTITLTSQTVDAILGNAIVAAGGPTTPQGQQLAALKVGFQCVLSPSVDACLAAPTSAANHPLADVYVGKVSGMTSFLDPADPANSTWQGTNPVDPSDTSLNAINSYKPDVQGPVDVPVIVTVPNANSGCAAPFPVTIYQHGITSNRATLLALGMSLASACQVGVAIDLPEHGVVVPGADSNQLDQLVAGLHQVLAASPLAAVLTQERLVADGAAPGGACVSTSTKVASIDGRAAVCPSGDSYVNLFNLANARDVLRQSVVDLNSLYLALKGTTTLAGGGVSIDNTTISFVGMSLGAIVGETFVSTLGNIGGSLSAAVFNVGGGGIAKLLDGSPTFEPVITQGLAAQGVTKPSADYESFLLIAQTLVDSADPINYTADLVASGIPVLFQEVVGNGSSALPDQVVPNNVFGPATGDLGAAWSAVSGSLVQASVWASQNQMTTPSVFGGTDSLAQGTAFLPVATIANTAGHPLQAAAGACVVAHDTQCVLPSVTPFYGLGLPQVGPAGAAGSGLVRFTGGTHSSLLDPASNQLVTVMMQVQLAGFIQNAGAGIAGESACTPVIGAVCAGTIASW